MLGKLTENVPKNFLAARKLHILLVSIAAAAVLWYLYISKLSAPIEQHTQHTLTSTLTSALLGTRQKPDGFKIIGLVFYGRHSVVEILDCYLRKNLAINGGYLDEVQFVVHTDKDSDLRYLDDLIAKVERYEKVIVEEEGKEITWDWQTVWTKVAKPENMYVKIDDDMVWMNENAVPELVNTLVDHPEAFSIQVNLINSATLSFLHYHIEAIHSYMPEREPPLNANPHAYGPLAWRASALAPYLPAAGGGEIEELPESKKTEWGDHAAIGSPGGAPYKNHRWLPLRDNGTDISRTPIAQTEWDAHGPDWQKWTLAAQKHYSLLEDIENDVEHGSLSKYYLGGGGVWNMRYMHANINMMAIWGRDIPRETPWDPDTSDDEEGISVVLPRRLKRETLVQTRALAAHFSFWAQPEVYDTDLLSRYRAYANEMVCAKDNQIPIPRDGG